MFWDARLENQAFRNSLLQCYFACACCCMPSNGSSSLARHQQDFHLLKIFFALWNFALLGRENDSLVPCHCHGDFLICGAGCRPGTVKLNQACRQNCSTSVAQEVLQSVRRSTTKMEDCEVGEGVTLSICRSNPLSKPPQDHGCCDDISIVKMEDCEAGVGRGFLRSQVRKRNLKQRSGNQMLK